MLCYQQEKPDSKESPSQRERNAKKSNVTYTFNKNQSRRGRIQKTNKSNKKTYTIVSLVSGKHCLLLDKFQYICQRPVLMMEIDCEREKEIDTMEKLLNKRIKKSVNHLSRCIIAFEKKNIGS